ncbi:glycoside hydrolase family 5 protein [Actomonas aquatica]|uniref:Cellulase family glycosylhydrolase n=1 Tax=Actomonas aquatica TaxID=2866162 RepID=A0ABZ1C7N0_9BACT|nr:cellulase family glycosylhydrolase [Opitutus sp. WL0086]WRQ87717.1 cellulase family glycosylhydrolase [Opitutus sp. WL0086]
MADFLGVSSLKTLSVRAIAASLLVTWAGIGSTAVAEQTFSDRPEAMEATAQQSFIGVDGNRFVNEAGETVIFRGLAFSDPASLLERGVWGRGYFEAAKSWNANLVRIPIHPGHWKALGEKQYLSMLDDAVRWAGELDMYVIIDWHTIGNPLTGVFHGPNYITSRDETFRFWHTIANRYRNNPTVAFYELWNEATNYNGQFGRMPWGDYKAFLEDLIWMIQKIDPKVVPLVCGFNWGYDLRNIQREPIEAKGIGYVVHPYPQKSKNWDYDWEQIWGFAAQNYPVIATEFGFMREDEPGSHNPVIGDEVYGEAIIKFFEERGISWTPWVFDPLWTPNLILDWDYTPSTHGAFFRQKMMELNK